MKALYNLTYENNNISIGLVGSHDVNGTNNKADWWMYNMWAKWAITCKMTFTYLSAYICFYSLIRKTYALVEQFTRQCVRGNSLTVDFKTKLLKLQSEFVPNFVIYNSNTPIFEIIYNVTVIFYDIARNPLGKWSLISPPPRKFGPGWAILISIRQDIQLWLGLYQPNESLI